MTNDMTNENSGGVKVVNHEGGFNHQEGAVQSQCELVERVVRQAIVELEKDSKLFGEGATEVKIKSDGDDHTVRLLGWDDLVIRKDQLLGEGAFSIVYECEIKSEKDGGDEPAVIQGDTSAEYSSTAEKTKSKDRDGRDELTVIQGDPSAEYSSTAEKTTKSKVFAVKYLKPETLKKSEDPTNLLFGAIDLVIESKLLSILNHPHIVKLYGIKMPTSSLSSSGEPTHAEQAISQESTNIESTEKAAVDEVSAVPDSDDGENSDEYRNFIVLERLSDTLDNRIGKLTQDQEALMNSTGFWNALLQYYQLDLQRSSALRERLQTYAVPVATAMAYLHSQNIIFRDLKPGNIGIDEDDTVKLFDLGLARELKNSMKISDGRYEMTGNSGSRRYMAPEVASEEPYGLSADVYSFAIVLWQLCALEQPFRGFSDGRHMRQVVKEQYRPPLDTDNTGWFPSPLKDLLNQCWAHDPTSRPPFDQVVELLHDIISQLPSQETSSKVRQQKKQQPQFKDAFGNVRTHPIQDLRPTKLHHVSRGPFLVAKHLIYWFTDVKGQGAHRMPTPLKVGEGPGDCDGSTKRTHVRFITIKPSHYCEKARWALDIAEADPNTPYFYTEEPHPPALHSYSTLEASDNTASVTPMVVFFETYSAKPTVMTMSNEIVKRFCPNLYPEAIRSEIEALEMDLQDRLGTCVRVVLYHTFLQDGYYDKLATICGSNGVSFVEGWTFRLLIKPLLSKAMRKIMKISDESFEFSRRELILIMDELSERLESTGLKRDDQGQVRVSYLMDTSSHSYGFTAADLTLSALIGPLLLIPEFCHSFAHNLLDEANVPPALLHLSKQLKATKAGEHVARCYQEHRLVHPQDMAAGHVVLKGKSMNRLPYLFPLLSSILSLIVVLFSIGIIYQKN